MDDSSLEGDKPDGNDEAEPLSGWRRSSFCGSNGHCVEVTRLADGHAGVRDSKDPQGPILRFTPEAWGAFLQDIRNTRPTNQKS
jgi:hypothetical protein